MISDPQAITRTLLRPIHSRPLPRGHIDLAGLSRLPTRTRVRLSKWLVGAEWGAFAALALIVLEKVVLR